jgi:hypothetical protein
MTEEDTMFKPTTTTPTTSPPPTISWVADPRISKLSESLSKNLQVDQDKMRENGEPKKTLRILCSSIVVC